MNRSQLELDPGVILDARRAVWLPTERTLVVADLHLGFVWTHRAAGQLLPVSAPDDTLQRLAALIDEFAPRETVLLGDIVHGGCELEAIREQLRVLLEELGARTRLRLVEGNHDARLARRVPLEAEVACGAHLLLHGHRAPEAAGLLHAAIERGGRLFLGHEHPAIRLSDGVASSARVPAFLVGPGALVLPSFSPWSSGTSGNGGWLSPISRLVAWERVVATLAGKLLPLPYAVAKAY